MSGAGSSFSAITSLSGMRFPFHSTNTSMGVPATRLSGSGFFGFSRSVQVSMVRFSPGRAPS